MHSLIKKTYTLLVIFGFLAVSCRSSFDSDEPRIPPQMLGEDIFLLDFTGMFSSPAGAKEIEISTWLNRDGNTLEKHLSTDEPFEIARAFLTDYRRGMISQIRSIFFTTFQGINDLEPERHDNIYEWKFTSGVYDAEAGLPMIWKDLRLVAERMDDGVVDWKLYIVENGDDLFIAHGITSRNHLTGDWIFFFHDGMKLPAFHFNWERRQGETIRFDSQLHFVNVTTTYKHDGNWIFHKQDRRETPETSVFADVRWNRVTGEGSIFINTPDFQEGVTLCWDQNREPLETCVNF